MPASGLDFSALLARARHGDHNAFVSLFAPLEPDLRAMAHRRLAGLQARLGADDVTQETYLNAWQSLPRLEHDNEITFRVWLMLIHRTTLLKRIRYEVRKKRSPRLEAPLPSSGSSAPVSMPQDRELPPSRIARRRELHDRLVFHLSRLSDQHRQVLCMKYFEGLSYAEMRDRTGLTDGQLQGRLRRALESLRAQAGPDLKTLLSGLTN